MFCESLVIESGIPAPSHTGRQSIITTMRSLRVGESVLVPGKTAKQLSGYIRAAKVGADKYFQSKTMTTGTRVWRLE